jgi:hypothetical protein
MQYSETMLKDKFDNLLNRIFLRRLVELLREVNMNLGGAILRICLIQSLFSAWSRL